MATAKNKTTETKASVSKFIAAIKDEQRRKDFTTLAGMIEKQTGFEPKMWGTAIVGFGSYHYKYESGREGDAPLTGLASRANAITLYIANTREKEKLLPKLGKHKTGKSCVYIQKLEDIDTNVLMKMVKAGVEHMKDKNEE